MIDFAARIPPPALRVGLAARLRRLTLFPGFILAARLGIDRLLHRLRTEAARRRIAASGLDHLRGAIDPDAIPQDTADLWHVYRTVRRRRPRRCIEFGSGQTTLFLAQALFENGGGHLYSLDTDARWLGHTEALLPAHLKGYVTLVYSPAAVNRTWGEPAWEHTVIPQGEWDFVLIDGPAGAGGITASCDLVLLASRIRPGGGGFIDHRWRTAMLTRECAGQWLRMRYCLSLESFLFERR